TGAAPPLRPGRGAARNHRSCSRARRSEALTARRRLAATGSATRGSPEGVRRGGGAHLCERRGTTPGCRAWGPGRAARPPGPPPARRVAGGEQRAEVEQRLRVALDDVGIAEQHDVRALAQRPLARPQPTGVVAEPAVLHEGDARDAPRELAQERLATVARAV